MNKKNEYITGNNSHWSRDKRGLTLVEMVVVVGLFGVAMTISMTILVNALRDQRTIRAEQTVISSARDALEVLAREVRLGYIDYDGHYVNDNLDNPNDDLYIDASNGRTYRFFAQNGQIIADDGGANPTTLSSANISIDKLKFYVRPTSDPYFIQSCSVDADCDPAVVPIFAGVCVSGTCQVIDQQPTVTIVLSATNSGQGFAKVDLQTTITVRTYKR